MDAEDNTHYDALTQTFSFETSIALFAGDLAPTMPFPDQKVNDRDRDVLAKILYGSQAWSQAMEGEDDWEISTLNSESVVYTADLDGDCSITDRDMAILMSQYNFGRTKADYGSPAGLGGVSTVEAVLLEELLESLEKQPEELLPETPSEGVEDPNTPIEDEERPGIPPAGGEDKEDPGIPPAIEGEGEENPEVPPAGGEDKGDPGIPPAIEGEGEENPEVPPAGGEEKEDPGIPPVIEGEGEENPEVPPAGGEEKEDPGIPPVIEGEDEKIPNVSPIGEEDK